MIKHPEEKEKPTTFNRRSFIAATGLAVAGGALAGSVAMADIGKSKQASAAAPALPWPWKKLDPMEAGRRAFNYYHEKGG